jgi:hypothetical protein
VFRLVPWLPVRAFEALGDDHSRASPEDVLAHLQCEDDPDTYFGALAIWVDFSMWAPARLLLILTNGDNQKGKGNAQR